MGELHSDSLRQMREIHAFHNDKPSNSRPTILPTPEWSRTFCGMSAYQVETIETNARSGDYLYFEENVGWYCH